MKTIFLTMKTTLLNTSFMKTKFKFILSLLLFVTILPVNAQKHQKQADLIGSCSDCKTSDHLVTFEWSNVEPFCDGYYPWCAIQHLFIIERWVSASRGWEEYYRTDDKNQRSQSFKSRPNQTKYVRIKKVSGNKTVNCCYKWQEQDGITALTTGPLKPPINLRSIPHDSSNLVTIEWDKGSDQHPDYLHYEVYDEDGRVVGSTISFRSSTNYSLTFSQEELTTKKYKLKAIYRDYRGPHEQSVFSQEVVCTTWGVGLSASQRTNPNYCRLEWEDVADHCDRIKIYRDDEEIAILDKASKSYTDTEGVPGRTYTYKAELLGSSGSTPISEGIASGGRQENGGISGYVKSRYGAPIPNCNITVEGNVDDRQVVVSATTDVSGFYSIEHIYYDESAEFTITPALAGHDYSPTSLSRTLSLSNNRVSKVDFEDISTYTIMGKVFANVFTDSDSCFLDSVKIFVNGDDVNTVIQSDEKGEFSIALLNPGIYSFTPSYLNHKFSKDTITLDVNGDYLNLRFKDLYTDTLRLFARGACGYPLGDSTLIKVVAKNSDGSVAAQRNISVDENGIRNLELPGIKYETSVVGVYADGTNSTIKTNYLSEQISLNLRYRDSLYQVSTDSTIVVHPEETRIVGGKTFVVREAYNDTTVVTDSVRVGLLAEARYLYRDGIGVDVLTSASSVCLGSADEILLAERGESIQFDIISTENYKYKGKTHTCQLSDYDMYIFDDLADSKQAVVLEDNKSSKVTYTSKAGLPKVTGDYQKFLGLEIVAKGTSFDTTVNFIITGESPRTGSFYTKTPNLPFFILHDPPGGTSYASLAKDSTVESSYSSLVKIGGGGGFSFEGQIGFGSNVPFVGPTGVYGKLAVGFQAGRDNYDGTDIVTTFSSSEEFSTSDDPNFVGVDADIVVGGSMNVTYAVTDKIGYNQTTCSIEESKGLAFDFTGFNTTYNYTIGYIKESLIPSLEFLKESSEIDSLKITLQASIDVWKEVIARNDSVRNLDDLAKDKENISFSSGASYSNVITTSEDKATTYEYEMYIDTEVAAAIGVSVGEFNGFEAGIMANFGWSKNVSKSRNISTSKTFTYNLSDDSKNDYYSVDVLEDPLYGTPLFNVKGGASSCPHEEGTQYRDKARLTARNTVRRNVPVDGEAVYTLLMQNLSESEEERAYTLSVDPSSNLDGAEVYVSGANIGSANSAEFAIPAGRELPVKLVIKRGALASEYKDIEVTMGPVCDLDGDSVQYSSVLLSAYFISNCEKAQLIQPSQGWLVNSSSNNLLGIVIGNYDKNNPLFKRVEVQYRRQSQNSNTPWELATSVNVGSLANSYHDISFDVTNLDDGMYDLRLVSICENDRMYSPVYSGTIDRVSSSVTFSLTPEDGLLEPEDLISISFSEDIDCENSLSTPSVKLVDITGEEIPSQYSCLDNKMIIQTSPASLISSYEGQLLEARVSNVSDIRGNKIPNESRWSFRVALSPYQFSPASTVLKLDENDMVESTATIINKSNVSVECELFNHSSWLSIENRNITIPANSSQEIVYSVSNLGKGLYKDTIYALIGNDLTTFILSADVSSFHPTFYVNPSDFQNSMNVFAQFSIDGGKTTSTDVTDVLAAYVNDTCRGVAAIKYDHVREKYSAPMTIHSNRANESIEFRIWDSDKGMEIKANTNLPFIINSIVGTPANPYVFICDSVYQNTRLKSGWNWVSIVPDIGEGSSVDEVLKKLKPNNAEIVKDLESYSQSSGGLWYGTLDSMHRTKGYLLKIKDDDILKVLGAIPDTVSNVNLVSGWNWVGQPTWRTISIEEFFNTRTGIDSGEFINSQTEFAVYDKDLDIWSGSLEYLTSGNAYKVKTSRVDSVQLKNKRSVLGNWIVDPTKYEFNMNITCTVEHLPEIADQVYVGAFINDTICGIGEVNFESDLGNRTIAFMTIYGKKEWSGKEITFKVVNKSNLNTYSTTYNTEFVADQVLGNVLSPENIKVVGLVGVEEIKNNRSDYLLRQNIPNPSHNKTDIGFSLPESTVVNLYVYDLSGRVVAKLIDQEKMSMGENKVTFTHNSLPKGIYFYRLFNKEISLSKKMIVH